MSAIFDELWRFISGRSAVVTVQEYHELKHVYELIKGCHSYLEVGTAEGNSLYVLAHALAEPAMITIVDMGESHTDKHRHDVMRLLGIYSSANITEILGNSHDAKIVRQVQSLGGFDVVLIDAGHTYEDVIADAVAYGSLATKYILFHDVCLPEVSRAFEWYRDQRPDCEAYRFVNSKAFGYGIMRIK